MQLYFSDFETLTKKSIDYKKLGHTDVYLAYSKSIDAKEEHLHRSLDEYMEWAMTGENKLIWFHNLSFDGNYIFKWLLRNYPDKFNNWLGYQDEECWRVFKNGNRYYKIEINLNGVSVEFKCTLNLLSSSISELAKCYDLEKLEEMNKLIKKGIIKDKEEYYAAGGFNMDPEVDEAFVKYIKQDVEVARLSFLDLCKNIENICEKFGLSKINVIEELTIGGISYKISEEYLKNKWYDRGYKLKREDYENAHKYYYGGWTQYNPDYWNKELRGLNGVAIDINSSYPFQMTKLLPYGPLKESRGLWAHYLEYYELEVESAIIKPEYKNFIILKNWKRETPARYCKELKDFKCFYCKEEWEFINKIYDIKVKTKKVWYSEAKYLLKELVEELYKLKEHYAILGEDALKWAYKILLNVLYGKQCSRIAYPVEYYIPWEDRDLYKQMKDNNDIIELNDIKYIITTVGVKKIPWINACVVLLEEINLTGWYTNILIGAKIASNARLQLWEVIYKVGPHKFMYCDTDSIFFNLDKNEKISDYVEIHDTKLGAWGIDCEFVDGKILGAKRYCFVKQDKKGIKFGFSGANKIDINAINWDKIIVDGIEIKNSQTYREEDDYGILIGLRDLKIKKGGN